MREIILVGRGDRADSWRAVIERARKLQLVAIVGGDAGALAEGDGCGFDLRGALDAHPRASVCVVLPPSAAAAVAISAADRGRSVLTSAPVRLRAPLSERAKHVQVAHGWVTLPGCARLGSVLAEGAFRDAHIEVRGLPEEPGGDISECMPEGLALARRALGGFRVESASLLGDQGLDATLVGALGLRVTLRVWAGGHGVEVVGRGPRVSVSWRFRDGRETFELDDGVRSARSESAPPDAIERALRQLVDPDRFGGDTLEDAAGVERLCHEVLALLPGALPPARRVFRHAALLARRTPHAIACLGLRAPVTTEPLPEGTRLPSKLANIAFDAPEAWAFRAGLKPVAFVTVLPSEVQATRALFPGAYIELRERRVLRGFQDEWVDDRVSGDPRVELYIGRDRDLVKRAASLQAESDPSAATEALGELMGYPACCVAAFRDQKERNNNTFNRYATAARTIARERWPWELNNLFHAVVPFFPCRYDCPAALDHAEITLAEFGREHPGELASLERLLSKPVLYFTDDRLATLDGTGDVATCRYSDVVLPATASAAFEPFARELARGTSLTLGGDALVIETDGGRLCFDRTDPMLGVLCPFSAR